MKITITAVDLADPQNSTDICHVVSLSDGRTIYPWSGKPCFDQHDWHTGPLVVGAVLTEEVQHQEPDTESGFGDKWTEFCFSLD